MPYFPTAHARAPLSVSLARQLLSTVSTLVQAYSKAHATAAGALQRAADERPCCIPGYYDFCMTSPDGACARCRCCWFDSCSALLAHMSRHPAKRTRRRRTPCSVRQTSGRVGNRVVQILVCRVSRPCVRPLSVSLARRLLSTVRGHVQAHSKAHATAADGLQRAADERPCCIPGC
jgi:hypothetical protein